MTTLWSRWRRHREQPPVVVNVHVKGDVDPRKVAQAVLREMRLYQARNGGMGRP